MGYKVVQLVEALGYMPEGRRFDSRWGYWDFSLTQSPTMAQGSTQPLTETSIKDVSWG